ncbi:MAG: PAS domain S-box protein [Candidatus Hodarchaeales archaeon]
MSEQEQRYRALFERTNDAVFILSLDLVHLDVNQRAADLLGYTKDKLIGMSAKDIVVPQEYPDSLEVAAALEARKIVPIYERTFRKKDSSEIVMELNVSFVEDADGNPLHIQSVARDITDRKQAEQALRESEERFRTIFRDSRAGIALVEITEDGHLGSFLEVNDAFCHLTGLPHSEIDKLVPRDLVTPEEYDRLKKEGIIGSWLQDDPIDFETSFIIRDGTTKFVEVSAPKIWLDNEPFRLMIVYDFTGRKQAEAALKESEERYRDVVEQSIQGLGILQDGRFVFANSALAEMYGGPIDELLALSAEEAWERVYPEDRERIWKSYQDRLEGKTLPARTEYRVFDTDGQIRWILSEGTLITFQGKLGIQSVYFDITNRKKMEERLRQQKEELSELAHAMNHDLQNKLFSIISFNALLQKEYDAAYHARIDRLAKTASAILRRSVNLADAGLIAEKVDAIDLTNLVEEVARATIPDRIAFVHNGLSHSEAIKGDRPKVSQVFENLFRNAVTHGQPSRIEVERIDSPNLISIRIRNDGAPIPSDHRQRIFQRSYSTQKGEGKGLGLAIAQKIVKAHGWELSLEDPSEPTFRIDIPL